MKVSIITVSRKSGKYGNIPCKRNISLLEDGTDVGQYINDLYFSGKLDGKKYLKSLKLVDKMTLQNKSKEIEKIINEL